MYTYPNIGRPLWTFPNWYFNEIIQMILDINNWLLMSRRSNFFQRDVSGALKWLKMSTNNCNINCIGIILLSFLKFRWHDEKFIVGSVIAIYTRRVEGQHSICWPKKELSMVHGAPIFLEIKLFVSQDRKLTHCIFSVMNHQRISTF